MCQLEGAFGQLHVPLPIDKVDLQFSLLHLVAKMHQLHVCKVGISEIQNECLCADMAGGSQTGSVWSSKK